MPITKIDLFRSVHKDNFPDGVIVDGHAVAGVLHPTFGATTYEIKVQGRIESRTRRADVTPYPYQGQSVVDPGSGTSLFDKANTFGTKYWWYFKIPCGTIIPDSLRIRHTGHNDVYDSEHYQIEAASIRMPKEAYKGALDNLARNAVVKLYEDAR